MDPTVNEILAVWTTAKLLSPLLLLCLSSTGGCLVYYMRDISKSIRHISTTLVKHEERFERHEDRIEALERHCPVLDQMKNKGKRT